MENEFELFMKENKEKIIKLSEENCKRDVDNKVTINEDDSWINEDEWDELYDKLTR